MRTFALNFFVLNTPAEKTRILILYYLRLVGLYIVFFFVYGIVSKLFPELLDDTYEQTFLKDLIAENPLQLFVLAVIFAPIIEEMMFRTLIKPSHNDLILFLCSWPVFYTNGFIPKDVHWVVKLLFIAVLLGVLFYILKELIPTQRTTRLRAFLKTHCTTVLILCSLIFGLVHINNYVEDFIINPALVALITPRILSGIMMGLIKVKNDHLSWSMGLHAINNGVVFLLFLIVKI